MGGSRVRNVEIEWKIYIVACTLYSGQTEALMWSLSWREVKLLGDDCATCILSEVRVWFEFEPLKIIGNVAQKICYNLNFILKLSVLAQICNPFAM